MGKFETYIEKTTLANDDIHLIADSEDLDLEGDLTTKKVKWSTVLSEIDITASQVSDFDTEVSNNVDVAANTTHRTSDGTDHTYIDQDLTTTATPEHVGLDLTDGLSNPTYKEGRIFYDDTKKAISYYNDISDITINLGQELLIKVCNETGSTIPNGSIVYPAGVSGGCISIDLADASKKEKSRLFGMVTHDIPTGTEGYVTRFGEVSGLDTSSYTSGGILYLSATTAGAYTDVKPDDGAYRDSRGIFRHLRAGVAERHTHQPAE